MPLSLNGKPDSFKEIIYPEYAKFPSIKTGDPDGININSAPTPFDFQSNSDMFL